MSEIPYPAAPDPLWVPAQRLLRICNASPALAGMAAALRELPCW
ncbi:hypothetical protein [Acidisphaera sp. L21]|nr:hypothetical protein [Acidisphaera sp. L21]